MEHQWTAKWINQEQTIPDPEKERPASYLKKKFYISHKESSHQKVTLYATAHGIYNIYINGHHVDGFVMAPGTSEYRTILQYQKYDVTDLIQDGENEILAVLGNGWWRGTITYDGIRNGWGSDTALLAEICAGEEVLVKTDETWLATQEGPLRDTDNMDGEIYDARREKLLEEETIWHKVSTEDFGYENLKYSHCPPPSEHECFPAKRIITPKGEQVLDFGQNIAGYISFSIEAHEGETLEFLHGETLDGDGNFCNSNFQSENYFCQQKITYICKEGKNDYKPTNTFMGFRYVLVKAEREINPEDFQAHAVYTDLKTTADFACGNALVNQLFRNSVWSLKGNLLDIPTDCPTREKSGFTGDLASYIHTFLYLMDAKPMIEKFIANQCASQREDGCTKQIVADPREYGMMDGAAGWSDSICILPDEIRKRYGDDSLFETYYDNIRAWVDFCIRTAAKGTRECHRDNPYHAYLEDQRVHWGEWCEPGMDFPSYFRNVVENGEPEVGTAYLYHSCRILADYAEKTGRTADAAYYGETAENVKAAYRYEFTENGRIHSERMCRYVRPIAFGLLEKDEEAQAAADLKALVEKNGYTLNTGFLTTHMLCRTLSDHGYEKTAYNLLLNETMPGWLYSVKCGATTVPENWDAYQKDGTRQASFNHYAYGAITGWLMDTVLGIRLEDGVLTICPKPDRRLGFAEGTYDSPVGKVSSGWKYENNTIRYEIEIPEGTKAWFISPDGSRAALSAGKHSFSETEKTV